MTKTTTSTTKRRFSRFKHVSKTNAPFRPRSVGRGFLVGAFEARHGGVVKRSRAGDDTVFPELPATPIQRTASESSVDDPIEHALQEHVLVARHVLAIPLEQILEGIRFPVVVHRVSVDGSGIGPVGFGARDWMGIQFGFFRGWFLFATATVVVVVVARLKGFFDELNGTRFFLVRSI